MSIPESWMPQARMARIHVHWTAGSHKASDTDRRSYHILVEGDGRLVRGHPSIKLNERPVKGSGYAAHTLNANSGAIGVSLCCMGGREVCENPFVCGPFPMTRVQWDRMVEVVAALAKRYEIPVTSKTILTHAEVEPNLGIRQRGKWDVTRLAFDLSVAGARNVGDRLRKEVAVALDKGPVATGNAIPHEMKAPRFRVSGVRPSTLNFRDAPNGVRKGALPENTLVEKLNESGGWWQVRTQAGFVGWVWSEFLRPAD
jgi:hypothetical protein